MLTASVKRLKALQDAVDDKWVVLVAYSNQITVALQVCRKLVWPVRFSYVYANWATCQALHYFVEL